MSKKLRVLVTGSQGLVGSHFCDQNTDFIIMAPTQEEFNLQEQKKMKKYLEVNKLDWVVNFAAFTDVTKAEMENGDLKGDTWQINVKGVRNILKYFKSKNIIQISTDMVFPGNAAFPGPYSETDTPPNDKKDLTWYGWTKNRGERLIKQRGGTVLRIIYPISFEFDKRPDYIRGPIKKFVKGKLYPLFNDQQISITYIHEITQVLNIIINSSLRGVYHVSSNTTTPYDLIKKTLEELGENTSSLKSASVVEFLKTQSNPSRYPIYGGLKAEITEKKLGVNFSSWDEVVAKIPAKSVGPREYINSDIPNAVIVKHTKYFSEPNGFVMETADFMELGYYLGYTFEPRNMYAIWSPEGVGRGGHLENRSKLVTVLSGTVYYCLVDMRVGEGMKKVSEFYLGENDKSIGKSVLVPEGVIDYWIPIGGPAMTHSVADRPYNKFDNLIALNMKDPELGLHLPENSILSMQIDEDGATLNLKRFIEKMS